VRFKGGRYAFAEALRAARRNRNIFAAITTPPETFPRERRDEGGGGEGNGGTALLMPEIKYATSFVAQTASRRARRDASGELITSRDDN